MSDQITLTTNQLAEALDRSPRRVQQLAADGIIPKAARGRYPLAAITAFIRFLEADTARGPADLQAERARLTRAQADLAEATLAQRRGELLAREDVDAAVGAAFARVRAKLLSVPTKVAAEAMIVDTPAESEAIIREAIYEALSELSQTTPEDLIQGAA